MIKSLKPNQVFVFGSNSSGFHGAGAAGFAFRFDNSCNWRQDRFFLNAIKAKEGSNDRIGKWAVFGISRGFQVGRNGMSYAIETIKRPGLKRSTPLNEIFYQFTDLLYFANKHYKLEFLLTKVGSSLAGYKEEEVNNEWENACEVYLEEYSGKLPENIIKV